MKKLIILCLAIALTITGCSTIKSDNRETETDVTQTGDAILTDKQNLLTGSTYEELMSHLLKAQQNHRPYYMQRDGLTADADTSAAETAPAPGGGTQDDYSSTNIQVDGVDEADIIKTDGAYLYLVANQRVYLIDASASDNLKVVSTLVFKGYNEKDGLISSETPVELFIDSERARMTLIVSGYKGEIIRPEPMPEPITDKETEVAEEKQDEETADQPQPAPDSGISADSWYPQETTHFVTTFVYDISNKTEPVLLRQFSQEGGYVSARRIDESVYVISQEYQYWLMRDFPMAADDTVISDEAEKEQSDPDSDNEQPGVTDPQKLLPSVTDKDIHDEWQTLAPADIAIVPEGDISQQMTLSAINTVRTDLSPDVLAVIGSAGVVYASSRYIYIAAWQMDTIAETTENRIYAMPSVNTEIFRYEIGEATIRAAGQGKVPGTIINQFSMDEYNGYFRVATTTGTMWDEEDPSKNHVFILDNNLKLVGQVNDLASGEQIKSVRFMGDQAYVVTFRTIDPLFVLNLSQPDAPEVLGELKIPGYSTYLHPYAENMLLGFGYDVIETDETTAYHGGIKVSMFDISDFRNPREHDTLILGGAGSYSELLYQHKALYFDRNRQVLAFPAILTKASATTEAERMYSAPYFQGLVVLQVSDNFELAERALLTHMPDTSDEKYPYSQIQRAASIGDTLFTISPRLVRAYDMATYETIGEVELPGYDQPWS